MKEPIRDAIGRAVVRELARQWRAIESTKRGEFITEDARLSTVDAAPIVDAMLDVLADTFPASRGTIEQIKNSAYGPKHDHLE